MFRGSNGVFDFFLEWSHGALRDIVPIVEGVGRTRIAAARTSREHVVFVGAAKALLGPKFAALVGILAGWFRRSNSGIFDVASVGFVTHPRFTAA